MDYSIPPLILMVDSYILLFVHGVSQNRMVSAWDFKTSDIISAHRVFANNKMSSAGSNGHLKRTPKIGFQYQLWLNAGKKVLQNPPTGAFCNTSTFIKLPFSFNTFLCLFLSDRLRQVLLYSRDLLLMHHLQVNCSQFLISKPFDPYIRKKGYYDIW